MTESQSDLVVNRGTKSLCISIVGILEPIVVLSLARFGIGSHGTPVHIPQSIVFGICEVIAFILGINSKESLYGKLGLIVSLVSTCIFLLITFIREYLMAGSNIMGF